jgi:hypothetical protein
MMDKGHQPNNGYKLAYAALQAAISGIWSGRLQRALNTLEELSAALQDNPDIIDDIHSGDRALKASQADLTHFNHIQSTDQSRYDCSYD